MNLFKKILGAVWNAGTATPATPATVLPSPVPNVATVATVAVADLSADALASTTLEDFARSGLVLNVDSEVLGETVLFASDAYSPAPGDPITTTPTSWRNFWALRPRRSASSKE